MSDYKPVVKLLRENTGARRLSHVFDDFTEMFAISLRNAVDKHGWQEREDRYLQVVKPYTPAQLARFAEAFAHVVNLIHAEPRDVLGHLYMSLELGNEAMGQFYTPYDIAKVMAKFQGDTLTEQIEREGFARMYEPACGAGAFIIATSQTLRERGFNPQQQLHVTAEDLSSQAVHMVYIHLTLLHIPAVVYRRDTLTMETYDTWFTPAHILGGWGRRLRNRAAVTAARELMDRMEEPSPTEAAAQSWDDVFKEIA